MSPRTRSLWSSRPSASAAPLPRSAGDPSALVRRLPEAALLAANLVPAVGALFFGWSAFQVMLAFWTESGIIGAFNVLRILTATGPGGQAAATGRWMFATKLIVAGFFVLHFGIFMYGHGVFLFAVFGGGTHGDPEGRLLAGAREALRSPMLWALAASHACAFVIGWLWNGRYRRTFFLHQMVPPYRRIVAMHLALLAAAVPVLLLGAPAVGVVVLVAAKVAADLWVLRRELDPGEAAPAGVY